LWENAIINGVFDQYIITRKRRFLSENITERDRLLKDIKIENNIIAINIKLSYNIFIAVF